MTKQTQTFKITPSKTSLNLCDIDFVKFRKKDGIYEVGNVACSFDIEVSSFYKKDDKGNDIKCASMYAYVLGINGRVKLGRSWEEFLEDIKTIVEYYNLSSKKRLIIYVHNLQYEFQFIRKLFIWEQIFSLDERRPVYARTIDGIEFRCSYILSNKSLKAVGEELTKYKVEKLVGDLDYELIRNKLTPLSAKEEQYIINDGLVVMAYIEELIEEYGKISKIPLTSTGFIRNYCKEYTIVPKSNYLYRKLIKSLTLTTNNYLFLKCAYFGGFTHSNSFRVNRTYKNVSSYDFTSSYPAVMVAEKYPMSKAVNVTIKSSEQFNKLLKSYNCLFEVTFFDLESEFLYEHYISFSKCVDIEDYVVDNGRVVSAKKLHIVITELDYFIIKEVYKWKKFTIKVFYAFYKDYLPKEFIEIILKIYNDKTQLKDVEGREREYARQKNLFNALYGMCVTDPCKDETIYEENERKKEKVDLDTAIESYNNSKSRFLFYPWGIWITAYARFNLWTAILKIGRDYIYSDTDSVKILNREKYLSYFEEYNKNIVKKLETTLNHYNLDLSLIRPKNIKGEEKVLGVWDYEGTYDMFKTLGAKRYIYVKNNKLNITISGVSKKKGSDYLLDTYKSLDNIFDNFKDGIVFPAEYTTTQDGKKVVKEGNGKKIHTYIDEPRSGEVIDYLGNIDTFNELSSIHMGKTDYNLSLSEIYIDYLKNVKELLIL